MQSVSDKLVEANKKADQLAAILAKHPDAVVHKSRWGQESIGAASANSLVTKAHMYHSCGCCDDAVLYAGPYYSFAGEYVYSEPHQFEIGEKMWGEYREYDGWKDKMQSAGIPATVIEQVKAYLRAYARTNEDNLDDEV